MLITFSACNNITVYRLRNACHGALLDHYCYQTTNDFEKLLKQKDTKNTLKMATPILLIIGMHIGQTRLLKACPANAEYDLDKKLCERCICADKGNNVKIEEATAIDNNKNNNEKDL